MRGKAVIVHSLEQAEAAVAVAAEHGAPLTLLSAEGAACFAGGLWFRELVALAGARHPEVEVTAILDCADRPGDVLAGLRLGLKLLRFSGSAATAQALAPIAEAQGAHLLTKRIEALDLLDQADPAAACRAWLGEAR